MMRTTLDTEERNESSQLSLLPLTSTKFGIQFDSTADIWDYRDGVNKIHLNFCQLQNCSREFREQAKRVLAWYAENHSPDHLNNLFRRLQHFLRTMTKQISSVSAADLLNYRASLTESTAPNADALASDIYEPLAAGKASKAVTAQYAAHLVATGEYGVGDDLFAKLPPYLQRALNWLTQKPGAA